MKNIIENIKLGISVIVIGGILLYIGTLVLMPELTVKIFRFQPYIVLTESMEPHINVNDMVVITEFDSEAAQVGDIITFEADIDYNGTLEVITHYIYEIDRSGDEAIYRTHRFFEEGEIVTPDTWLIPESNVIGSYSFHVQYVGYFIGFITSIYGIVIIVVNVGIFTGIKYINKRLNEKEAKEAKELLEANNLENPKE